MLVGFYCPDKERVLLSVCLKSCRMGSRCLTLPTLGIMSKDRVWNGTASTTMLLNGTRESCLKITKEYYINPQSRAWSVQGSKHHQGLEDKAKELGLAAEVPLSIDRDIMDLLELEDGAIVLSDYKLWGSYHVVKAIGIVEAGKIPDPSGGCYKSSGKWGKAGTVKMINSYVIDPDKADNWETEMQLNNYRIKLAALGIKVDRMRIQATVRDGSTIVAYSRGVNENIYMIPVKVLLDDEVKHYFMVKQDLLHEALSTGVTDPCTPRESWEFKKCKEYCDVWEYCDQGIALRSMKQ